MEAAEFRDSHDNIAQSDAVVLGISTDTSAALDAFARELGLPYSLASDRTGEVRRLYDVQRRFGLGTSRVTYVIDSSGKIQSAHHNEFAIKSHAHHSIEILQALRDA
ncbi:MAG: redoxin domain-containing protein [Chloroflexi bacterium]|nr:redoxin domain-containing protein [Chloroflexota bacterium]